MPKKAFRINNNNSKRRATKDMVDRPAGNKWGTGYAAYSYTAACPDPDKRGGDNNADKAVERAPGTISTYQEPG